MSEEKRIAADSTACPREGFSPTRHQLIGTALTATLALVMATAFGTMSGTDIGKVDQQPVVESLLTTSAVTPPSDDSPLFIREEKIRAGDTVSSLVARISTENPDVMSFLRNDSASQLMFRQLSPGKTITAWVDSLGNLERLLFPLNGTDDAALVVEKSTAGQMQSRIQPLKLEKRIITKSAEIRHSLFGATDGAGIPDGIATQMAEIFSGDIDFHRDLRKGDRFAVVYEMVTHLGKEVRNGKVLAAEFINNGKNHRSAWFQVPGGDGGYYAPDGSSLRKAFLRSPLEFSRVTSGFTSSRFHPVLQQWRAHKGIDYGAPVGTRVRVTGNGVVEFAGIRGGYGKSVVVRHQGRYATLYAHLSNFAPGLRPGSHISQGDTIGFVGATGLASGPHLHYEFQNNGIHQNPLAVVLPTAPPLSAKQLPEFRQHVGEYLTRIDRIKSDSDQLALVNSKLYNQGSRKKPRCKPWLFARRHNPPTDIARNLRQRTRNHNRKYSLHWGS